MRFTIDHLDHLVLNVTDVELAAAWYQRVLGMEREDFGPNNRTALKFGSQKINLRPKDTNPSKWLAAQDCAAGTADLCFITGVEPDEVIDHLHGLDIAITRGPVNTIGALGAMRSVYCRDPDGNLIEIASYLDR
ncbi:MAG: VOC family protein [Acetobacteraceae bacterium]|nr:VOC family protein [Acetobacteraceae bacterium]